MNFTLALHNLLHFYLQENQDGDSIIGEFETSKANANNHLSYKVFSVQRPKSTLTQKVYHANLFDMDVLTSQCSGIKTRASALLSATLCFY